MKTPSLFFFPHTRVCACVPSLVESFLLSFKGKVAEMFVNGDKWLENELSALEEWENTATVTQINSHSTVMNLC